MKTSAVLPLLAACILAGPSALAATTSITSIEDVQWKVIDLTPDDGVAGGYLALNQQYRQLRGVVSSATAPYYGVDFQASVDETTDLDSLHTFGTSFAQGHAGAGFGSTTVKAFADDALGPDGRVSVNMSGGVDFMLLPHTQLVITGFVSWADSVTGGVPGWAQSSLQVGALDGDNPNPPIDFRFTHTAVPTNDSAGHQGLTLVYLNDTDTAVQTNFYVSVNAIAAVPEPTEAAMLLGGLAGLAVMGRAGQRRKRRHGGRS
ncbi:hypothetical protein [Massilia sp. TN1-12]|uniref:hypothetical protein n=1 Tax=Massilia paldalensis TaxID=3377675 RepID=UPI0038500B12